MDFNETHSALMGMMNREIEVMMCGPDGILAAMLSGTLADVEISADPDVGELLAFKVEPGGACFFFLQREFKNSNWSSEHTHLLAILGSTTMVSVEVDAEAASNRPRRPSSEPWWRRAGSRKAGRRGGQSIGTTTARLRRGPRSGPCFPPGS